MLGSLVYCVLGGRVFSLQGDQDQFVDGRSKSHEGVDASKM